MPPLVPVNKVEVEVLDEVPEMIGFSFAKYVFTDVSYGISDNVSFIFIYSIIFLPIETYPNPLFC